MTSPHDGSRGDTVSSREALEDGLRGARPLVVYQWRGWDGFLIKKIAPNAQVAEASPLDEVRSVIDRLHGLPGVFLFHINCSVTRRFPVQRDALIGALVEDGWIPSNHRAVDISKRWIQACLKREGCNSVSATRSGPGSEVVLVKSNYNHGGKKEKELAEEVRAVMGLDRIPTAEVDEHSYRVLPRSQVPEDWWDDPSLTVERFVGNRRGFYFRVSLAGDRCHLVKLANPQPIKKVGKSRVVGVWKTHFNPEVSIRDSVVARVLAEVELASLALGMDFGSMDVVLDDRDEPYVVDVNHTPWFNTQTYFPGLVSFLSMDSVPETAPPDQGAFWRILGRFQAGLGR